MNYKQIEQVDELTNALMLLSGVDDGIPFETIQATACHALKAFLRVQNGIVDCELATESQVENQFQAVMENGTITF